MLLTGMISPTTRLPNAPFFSLVRVSRAIMSSRSASGMQTADCQLGWGVSGRSDGASIGSGS